MIHRVYGMRAWRGLSSSRNQLPGQPERVVGGYRWKQGRTRSTPRQTVCVMHAYHTPGRET